MIMKQCSMQDQAEELDANDIQHMVQTCKKRRADAGAAQYSMHEEECRC